MKIWRDVQIELETRNNKNGDVNSFKISQKLLFCVF